MSTAFANESASTSLPLTGSGPFTLILGVVGVGAVGVGALLRAVGRSGPEMREATFGAGAARSLGAAAALQDRTQMDAAIAWLDQELEAGRWVDEQVESASGIEVSDAAAEWLDQHLAES